MDKRWIPALDEAGLFDDPPRVTKRENAATQYPFWWPGRHLAHLAEKEGESVVHVLAQLPVPGTAADVDFAHAVSKLPAKLGVTLLTKAVALAKWDGGHLLNHDLADAAAKFGQGGFVSDALALADALYDTLSAKSEDGGRSEDYWYIDGLSAIAEGVGMHDPKAITERICRWLAQRIKASASNSESDDDSSESWRPAIEDHEQNLGTSVRSSMVTILRNTLDKGIKDRKLTLDDALMMLAQQKWTIFDRLRLYLVDRSAEERADLARDEMMRLELLDEYAYRYEYGKLLERRFGLLANEDRDRWLKAVADGPDMSDYSARVEWFTGKPPTEAERKDRIQYWKLSKWYWVRAYLTGEVKAEYEQALAKHGEPDFAFFTSRFGPVKYGSPVSPDELKTLSLRDVVDVWGQWSPPASRAMRERVSMQGLVASFREYVSQHAPACARDAAEMRRAKPRLIEAFFEAITTALGGDDPIELAPVLTLAEWTASHPPRTPKKDASRDPTTGDEDAEYAWARCHHTVIQLLEAIILKKRNGSPNPAFRDVESSIRSQVRPVIENLLKHPATGWRLGQMRTEKASNQYLYLRDWYTDAINSDEGRAMGIALAYARWIRNDAEKKRSSKDSDSASLWRLMPEVMEWVETALSANPRSPEVMSILGINFGLLYSIDSAWLTENAERFFDVGLTDSSDEAIGGWAAWNTFIVWSDVYREFWQIFEKQYRRAVAVAAELPPEYPSAESSPVTRLGMHLVVLYGRGDIALAEGDGALGSYIKGAPQAARRESIALVGQSIGRRGNGEDLPQAVISRFVALWRLYWHDGPGREDYKAMPDSRGFGDWFASGKFDSAWALKELRSFSAVVGVPEPDHAVIEELGKQRYINLSPEICIEILNTIAAKSELRWMRDEDQKAYRTILKAALWSTPKAHALAVATINLLGRAGQVKFGELLDTK